MLSVPEDGSTGGADMSQRRLSQLDSRMESSVPSQPNFIGSAQAHSTGGGGGGGALGGPKHASPHGPTLRVLQSNSPRMLGSTLSHRGSGAAASSLGSGPPSAKTSPTIQVSSVFAADMAQRQGVSPMAASSTTTLLQAQMPTEQPQQQQREESDVTVPGQTDTAGALARTNDAMPPRDDTAPSPANLVGNTSSGSSGLARRVSFGNESARRDPNGAAAGDLPNPSSPSPKATAAVAASVSPLRRGLSSASAVPSSSKLLSPTGTGPVQVWPVPASGAATTTAAAAPVPSFAASPAPAAVSAVAAAPAAFQFRFTMQNVAAVSGSVAASSPPPSH